MNLTTVMSMSDKKLRTEIAKICGYTKITVRNAFDISGWKDGIEYYLPDWPVSMSDAYSLEGEIPEEKRKYYRDNLFSIVCKNSTTFYEQEWSLIHSTASEKSRAYLLTMGDE